MSKLPEAASKGWDERNGAVVLTTVDGAGVPNAIYATCVSRFDEETLVVADNYFNKTRKNILSGSKGSLLFITAEGTSYQVKGTLEYLTEGPVFEDMKKWNPARHPGHAAVALRVEEAFSGGKKLL
jgi:hypothetical protein